MIREFIAYYKKQRVFILTGCIVILLGVVIYTIGISSHRKNLDKEIYNTISQLTFSETARDEELKKLHMLSKKRYLTSEQKGILFENISVIYMLENDSSMYIFNSGYAIYQYEKAGLYEKEMLVGINLAKYLVERYEFGLSKEIILSIMNEENIIKQSNSEVMRKAYMTLADIYSKTGETKKAFSACKKAEYYILQSKKAQDFYKACLTVIKARIYMQNGQYKKAEKILNKVREKYYYTNDDDSKYILIEYLLPFLEVDAKLKAYDNKYDEAIKISDQYTAFCDQFSYNVMKLKLIVSLTEIAKANDSPSFEKFSRKAWQLYPEVVDESNFNYASNMLDSVEELIDELITHENDKKMKQHFLFSVMGLLFLIFIAIGRCNKVWKESCIDHLTGVCNRKLMMRIYEQYDRKKKKYGCIMIDVDNFKSVNDLYGHQQGDEILIGVARIAKRYNSKNITVFRYGGEEFLILYRTEKYENVVKLAEKIREGVEKLDWEDELKVTISVGTSFSMETDYPIKLADKRLYYSKLHGKNCVTTKGENN